MKTRILALAAALCLALSLCACSPVETSTDDNTTALPSEFQAIESSSAPTGDATAQPSEVTDPAAPAESESPAVDDPVLAPVENSAQPSETLSEAPSEAPAKATAAKDLYDLWVNSSSQFPAPGSDFVDMSSVVDAFYNVDTSDLADFYFAQPAMSGELQELFVAKTVSGKADTVKAACQSRLEGLKEEAAFYTDTGVYIDDAQLKTNGDWVLFYVGPDASRVAKIFSDVTN